jgi:ATP-binding cassette subfamily B protein
MHADELASVPFFSALSRETRDAVAGHAERIEVSEGTTLAGQERRGYTFFVIERGRAGVYQDERRLRELGDGEFFGEIALLRDCARTATVTASGDGLLYVLDRDAFLLGVSAHPRTADAMEGVAAARLARG